MSFVVTRRSREIGIRVALGATGGSAIRLVLGDAVVMIVAGIVIALPCVAALGKLVQSQVFGVTATASATVAGSATALGPVRYWQHSFRHCAPRLSAPLTLSGWNSPNARHAAILMTIGANLAL